MKKYFGISFSFFHDHADSVPSCMLNQVSEVHRLWLVNFDESMSLYENIEIIEYRRDYKKVWKYQSGNRNP